jgi:hypothetical protein
MADPIVIFMAILIVLAVAINKGASGMVAVAQQKNWTGWKQSEFAWKLVISLLVVPLITLLWL